MMLFVDQDLARRLEAAEAQGSAACVQELAHRSQDAAAVLPIAGGWAIFTGADSPLNQAKGLGMQGPVGEAEIKELEDFYWSRGAAVQVVLCPLADASLLALLAEREYRAVEFENELVRTLSDHGDPPESGSQIQVQRAGADDLALCNRIIATGFLEGAEVPPALLDLMSGGSQSESEARFLATIDGQAVGGGSLLVWQGVASLAGTSVLPEFRRRGVHTALIETRLSVARTEGCDLVKTTTQPGSGSQRNMARHGFQTAYTRVILQRDKP